MKILKLKRICEMEGFFNIPEKWEEEWQDMPEFVQENKLPFRTIYVHFKNEKDVEAFSKLIGQKISQRTKFVWYPKVTPEDLIKLKYVDSE